MDSTFSDFWSGLNPVKIPISMIDMLVFALSRYLQIKNNKENLLGRQVIQYCIVSGIVTEVFNVLKRGLHEPATSKDRKEYIVYGNIYIEDVG